MNNETCNVSTCLELILVGLQQIDNKLCNTSTGLELILFNLQRTDESLQQTQKNLDMAIKIQLQITIIDCKNMRKERQDANDKELLNYIIAKDKSKISRVCNKKELDRQLLLLKCDYDELLMECDNIRFATLLSSKLSINASRQCGKDELFVITQCNLTTEKIGINIRKLPNISFRPTKDGKIIEHHEYLTRAKNECFKSFDARITGKINGWVFAKIIYGNGGHQDNVFAEASQMGEWVNAFGDTDTLYVILIDTNLDKEFAILRDQCKKYQLNNLIVVNHVELQRYMLIHYS
jgi:hypothetical protein